MHLIGSDPHGALLREIHARDGCDLMLYADENYESVRKASINECMPWPIAPLAFEGTPDSAFAAVAAHPAKPLPYQISPALFRGHSKRCPKAVKSKRVSGFFDPSS